MRIESLTRDMRMRNDRIDHKYMIASENNTSNDANEVNHT